MAIPANNIAVTQTVMPPIIFPLWDAPFNAGYGGSFIPRSLDAVLITSTTNKMILTDNPGTTGNPSFALVNLAVTDLSNQLSSTTKATAGGTQNIYPTSMNGYLYASNFLAPGNYIETAMAAYYIGSGAQRTKINSQMLFIQAGGQPNAIYENVTGILAFQNGIRQVAVGQLGNIFPAGFIQDYGNSAIYPVANAASVAPGVPWTLHPAGVLFGAVAAGGGNSWLQFAIPTLNGKNFWNTITTQWVGAVSEGGVSICPLGFMIGITKATLSIISLDGTKLWPVVFVGMTSSARSWIASGTLNAKQDMYGRMFVTSGVANSWVGWNVPPGQTVPIYKIDGGSVINPYSPLRPFGLPCNDYCANPPISIGRKEY